MRASTRREFVAGPAGRIECAVDKPEAAARGVALIAHPHPLFGGSLDNKVVQTLARAFVELGYEAWRPNFRGVGETEGVHDEGRGELDDLQAVLNAIKTEKFILSGFSFGASLAAQLAAKAPPGGGGSGIAPRRWRRGRCPRHRPARAPRRPPARRSRRRRAAHRS
jgi:alpha/beta superfamily hydrolase